MTTFTKPFVLAGAIAGLALLPACSGDTGGGDGSATATQDDATRTIAAALGEMPEMSALNGAVSAAGLGSVFDGPGSYTLLAPTDAAFDALGDSADALMQADQKPVLAGLLRSHIIPGHLTPENIAQAIETKGGDVTMSTHGGGEITFAMDGDTITVTAPGGASAPLTGAATAANNGVIIPLGAVLVPEA